MRTTLWSQSRGGPPGPPSRPARRLGSYRDVNYWVEQGWKLMGNKLGGYYRTLYKAFPGHIDLFDSGKHRYFIQNPPPQLQQHRHWPCFVHKGAGLYWVHFHIEPRNVDTGIVTIEKILGESLERYW